MKISPIFAWYDLWVGVFWDRVKRKLYVMPFPTLGVVLDFSKSTMNPSLGIDTGASRLAVGSLAVGNGMVPKTNPYECAPGVGCNWCDTGRAIAKQKVSNA